MDKDIFHKMDSSQQRWYAKAMIATIMADDRVDEAEEQYLHMIYGLFLHSPGDLNQLKAYATNPEAIEIDEVDIFSTQSALAVLQNCMAVAIADAEFDPRERQMINKIGQSLHLSEKDIQGIISWGYQQLAHIFTFAT